MLPTTLLSILGRIVYKELKWWGCFLTLVNWTYRTSKGISTQAPPLSLVYGGKAIVPLEVMVHSTQFALASKLSSSYVRISHIEGLKERRHNKWLSCQKQINAACNERVKPRTLYVCDLVLKVARHV